MPDTSAAQPSEDVAAARLVRRVLAQWWLIVACAIVAAVAGYVASSSRPNTYQATTTIELNDIDLASVFLAQNLQQLGLDAQVKAATAAKIASLPKVRQAAADLLGGRATAQELKSTVSVAPQPDTTLVDISAVSTDPELAAAKANAVREAFIAARQEANAATLEAARDRVRQQLSGLTAEARRSPAGLTLQSRLEQLNTIILTAGAGVKTAQPATAPEAPISPSPVRDAILALLAGGLLGLGVAVLRARLDDRVRDLRELSERWELPVLGLIPESSDLAKPSPKLPSPSAIEAFALARTNLRYLHVGGEVRTIVVTSAIAEEGKSTVSWNLALAAAMAEQRVLLIEADLRRPVFAQRLSLTGSKGLSELLAGMATPAEVVRDLRVPVPGGSDARVAVVPAGFIPPSPIAMIERHSTAEVLRQLGAGYDLVIIDSPPATVVADAKVLLAHADGAVIVSRLGRVTRSALDRLRDTLQGLDTPILGTIVNSGASGKAYGYGGYYESSAAPSMPPAPSTPTIVADEPVDADRPAPTRASL